MPAWGEVLQEFLCEADAARLPPPRLAGYRVVRPLGAHGQSEVYLAEDAAGDPVAIKRWRLPSARAERELDALAQLDHPGVVRVRGGAEDAELGLPCLVMDYVAGQPLLAERRRLPSAQAAQALAEVADALAYVHARGLVHRDVKPANLVRRPDGRVVLIDFGLVKGLEPRAPSVEVTGAQPVGTLPYMAPEQLGLIEAPVGPAADLYGLGATLYQCLTGAVPFETNGAFERRGRDVWRDPPAGADTSRVPAGLRELVQRCLAFDPAARPAVAGEVAHALRQLERAPTPPPTRAVLPALALALGLGLLLSAQLAPSAPSAAPFERELVLQPGPLRGRDAHVSSVGFYRNDNYGPATFLRVGFRPAATGQGGEYQSFLAFDLGRLPVGAEVATARLELFCTHVDFGKGPSRLQVHEVRPSSGGRTPWVEGTGLLDPVLDGVAWDGSFNPLFERGASDRPELSAPDVAPEALVEWRAPAGFGVEAWTHFDLTPAVRRWQAEPATNLGVRLSAPELADAAGSWLFASSDHPSPELRPRLVIRYRGPPAPAPPDLAALHARARSEAEAQLAYAESLLRRGNREGAFAAISEACRCAPFWGRPCFARAQLARRMGLTQVVWLDSERSLLLAEPEPDPEALLVFAESWRHREGKSARGMAAAAAVLAACTPSTASRADAVLLELSRSLGEQLARPEFHRLVDLYLQRAVDAQARLDPHSPLAEAARVQAWFARAAAREPRPELATADDAAIWARVLLLSGRGNRAREFLAEARARWPVEPAWSRLGE